jgi:hypothetical protein
MSDDILGALVVGLPLAIMLCGVAIVITGMIFKARMLDLQHKERLAMIERGLTPPPESSPTGSLNARTAVSGKSNRARSVGVIIIGIGLAFMCLFGIAAASPQEAIGIGGAIVILGASFIVRSMLVPTPVEESPAAAVLRSVPPTPPVPPRES